MAYSIIRFESREELAETLARMVAEHLTRRVEANGNALLGVSGGSTPGLFFETLSAMPVPWADVAVTLVDERCVPESSDRSNTALVKSGLMRNAAADGRFVPLYDPTDGDKATEAAAARFAGQRFDVAVLGMGNDGHTASLFPDGDQLADAMDTSRAPTVMAMEAPGAGEPRLTFTLPVLLEADRIALHIEGDDKLETLSRAVEGTDATEMPIRAFLHHPDKIVSIYWAPKG